MPNLETQIARHLAVSKVGLHRGELFGATHVDFIAGRLERIADILARMERAGDAERQAAPGERENPRWRLTAKGRAAYSSLHDEADVEPAGIDRKAEKIQILEILESLLVLTDETRQLLAGIRADLEPLDAALEAGR